MQCPRLHGSLESILLNSDFSKPLQAYLCPQCHGIWMRSLECRAYLGLECEKLVSQSNPANIGLSCSHCQTVCRSACVPTETGDLVEFHICPRCLACFFDAAQFAIIFYQQLKSERAISGIMSQSVLDDLGVVCCDCGAAVRQLDDLHDVGTGYCCQSCYNAPPIFSENKLQNVQLVTFHGMEIKIDHWQMSTRSRISVTPAEPCLLDVRLYSLSPWQRIARMGHRKLKLLGELGRHLDATEDAARVTPWHVFLKQRGVLENIKVLNRLGKIEITFKPHSIIFELNAKRSGTETKQKFEATTRRILLAYEKFVQLSHEYVEEEEEPEIIPEPDPSSEAADDKSSDKP